jgi:c-di-GMP-binding flagellar brake protein YcgR
VVLKLGASKTAEILAKTLEANEARGRRKFVRATCPPGSGQCNVEHEGMTLRAELTDLSSAGMAIRFEGEPSLPVGSVMKDIAISVKGQRLIASGVVVTKRVGPDGPVHVLMFSPASLDESRRDKLKILVFRMNQSSMDRVLETA